MKNLLAPLLKRQAPQKNGNHPALLGSGEEVELSPERNIEYQNAMDLLELCALSLGRRNHTVFYPSFLRTGTGNGAEKFRHLTALATHHRPVNLLEAFRFYGNNPVMVLIRAVKKDVQPHVDLLNAAAKHRPLRSYQQYLGVQKEWSIPSNLEPKRGRDMVMWGPASSMIPSGEEATGALGGVIPQYDGDFNNAGPMLRSVLLRMPLSYTPVLEDPMVYAATEVTWEDSYYTIEVTPGQKKAYRFYTGILGDHNVEGLMALDVDVLARLRRKFLPNVNGKTRFKVYATIIIRAETSSFLANGEPDFRVIENQLARLGKFELLRGKKVRVAFKAYVPGAAPPPRWFEHTLAKPSFVLEQLTSGVSHAMLGGNLCLGWIGKETQYFIPIEEVPSILLLGPSNAGKTTLATAWMLQQGTESVTIQCSADPEAGANFWAPDFGGQVKVLEASLIQDPGTEEEIRERLKVIIEDATAFVAEAIQDYRRSGKVLPLVIRPEIEGSTLYFQWVHTFLIKWTEAWKQIHRETGRRCVVMVDDLVGIPSSDSDVYLGTVPSEVGGNLRKFLRWFLDNCRKAGIRTIMAAHTEEELREFPMGFAHSFSIVVELSLDDYQWATVREARQGGHILVKDLYIKLPHGLEAYLRRRDTVAKG
ncbi:hypothetical protein C4561_03755 [candidate division WWE3 bacterium]|uniref:Uncharacterized protein n=1 Tax=candidate division WWE3 bacterium TaxID=2053526 RepID=A0A3A4ZC84_UNCKA|nr:MAG: hypothetical protein C4561_03755 [candidate division WWE3 bacterium]